TTSTTHSARQTHHQEWRKALAMVRRNPERAFGHESPSHGINRNRLKYLVFAGNYRQFHLWATDSTIQPGEALYVASPTNLRGISGDDIIMVKVGTFHLRPDSPQIMEEARARFPNNKWVEDPIQWGSRHAITHLWTNRDHVSPLKVIDLR